VEPVIEGQIPMGVSSIFYIQLQNDQEIHLLENYAEQTRTSVLYQVPFCENWYALETDKNSLGNSIEMANQFWETGFFKAVDPGFMFHFTTFDNCVSDSLFNSQWGMQSIYACQAWNITTGSPNIRVAVIDKGVDVNHREFNHLNVSASYDVSSYSSPAHLYYTTYYNNDLHIYDTIYHGTLVGGVIFANHDSNRLAGIAPNASLINISHPLYSNADLTGEKFASAINYAVEQGAKVINNSWGSERRSDFTHAEMIESAIDNAIINNCVLVFSSGNNKTGPIWTTGMTYPSEYRPELLTVGAAENNLQRWNRSMYGSCLDVVAPGYNIMSTNGNNSYCRDEGTSLATPHVSGIAALMLATNPELSAQNVRDIIEQTAQQVGGYNYHPDYFRPNGLWNQEMGYGLVDAHKAVVHALEYGHEYISGPSTLANCEAKTYQCAFEHPELFTYTWSATPNLSIIINNDSSVIVIPVNLGTGTLSVNVYQQGRLMYTLTKNVQVTSVLSGITPIATLPFNISSNTTWSTETYLPVTATIDSNVTLTITSNLLCGEGGRIIVRPGGKLVVDGGTLTSACPGEMWQGIEVVGDRNKRQLARYQGTVELRNGARIENAHCAIKTGLEDDNWHTTGGIVKADSAFFVNNRRSVAFLSYTNHNAGGGVIDNQSYFYRCVFTVNDDNLFGQDNGLFIDHVTMWEVRGVKFKGCTFNNLTNNAMALRRHAIYTEDAGFILETYCRSDQAIPQGCECPENASRYNTFTGFNTALEANTAESQYAININHALFDNNYTAIKINGNPFATVTRCEVNLQQVPGQSLSNKGLVLSTCTGYKVEENTFSRNTYSDPTLFSSRGIEVDSSGAVANSLRLNNFENLGYGIYVRRNNGNHLAGLQATCNGFIHNKYDIYMAANATMKSMQGWSDNGADNTFTNTQTSSFRNSGPQQIVYFHSSGGNHAPYNVSASYVSVNSAADPGFCSSTLCNNNGWQPMLSGFSSQMNAYATALANQSPADGTDGGTVETQHFASLQTMRQTLSETYYTAVRGLMADTVLDLNELEQWHTAAQPIADPYSLTETRFMMGYSEPFVADADDAELSNYADFHAMKLALRSGNLNDNADNMDNNNSPGINWYALTPAQIAQLQVIAERNAGRASVMAKGVLCFFFGICYDDDLSVDDNADNQDNNSDAENRSAKAPQQGGETYLNVYPNPTDDVLYVELSGAGIQSAGLYDLQGRVVETHDRASLQGIAAINVRSVPAGVYVLRVMDENGREYHQKVVVK
jgi:hypothetical protein